MTNLTTNPFAGMTQEQLQAEVLRLQQENAKLSAPKRKHFPIGNGLSVDIGAKGGVSVYGMTSKFPVTLYASQWATLIQAIPAIQAFIQANSAKLATKPTVTSSKGVVVR